MRSILDRIIFFLFKNTLRRVVLAPIEHEMRLLRLQNGISHFSDIIQKIETAEKLSHIDIAKFEFKVFSQWGQDGIIQFLIHYLDIPNKTFVEFGSSHYFEANTRFLLMKDNWKGLVIDGSAKNINGIKNDPIYWQHNLIAVESFITRDNINSLIKNAGFEGETGLLSVDIDGNDYHVWEAINVISPVIVIVEYNSVFGSERAISVPYKEDFERPKAHFSEIYFGTSLAALEYLAKQKGYSLIYCNKHGNDAFFVRNDKLKNLPAISSKDAFKEGQFRMSRNEQSQLNFIDPSKLKDLLTGLPILNVASSKTEEL